MKAIVKGAVISGAGALLLGASLALSSATLVSGADVHQPKAKPTPPTSIKCKSIGQTACLTVQNTSSSGNAIEGQAKSGAGAYGLASSGAGLYGRSKSGPGVYGYSQSVNSAGVYGVATSSANGVYGNSNTGSGVDGVSESGSGVQGISSTGYGLYGDSASSSGIVAESAETNLNNAALYAQADASNTLIFIGSNSATSDGCIIDNHADLSCSGMIVGGAVRVRHPTSSGQHVLAYSSEATSATIEDFGTARMFDGVANVYFERDFASTIDRNSPYYVFLTPLGDTRGLFVSIKTDSGFQVRETGHGRSTLSFDYRIVARPLDSGNNRLPLAPAMRMPPKAMHPTR